MDMSRVAEQGLVLLGCGKMGSAMLAGWLEHGLPASAVWVIDPYPSDWLKAQGVNINTPLPEAPAVGWPSSSPSTSVPSRNGRFGSSRCRAPSTASVVG